MYLGAVCSALTDGLIPVAFSLEIVRALNSPGALTAVLLSLWVARFTCVPIAGRLAARRDTFLVMIGSDIARSAAQIGLAVAITVTSQHGLLVMCASAALYGAASACYGPAMWSIIPRIVDDAGLEKANAVLAVNLDVSVLVGPALAAIAMATIGFTAILILDGLTFLANVVALAYARRLVYSPRREVAESAEWGDSGIVGGESSAWSSIRRHRWLGWSTALWFLVSFTIGVVSVAGPVLTIRHSGNQSWAVLATAMAAASLIGSVSILAGLRRLSWSPMSILLGVAFSGEAAGLAGYTVLPSAVGMWILCTACIVAGIANSIGGIVWQASLQRSLESADLARFVAVEGFVNSVGVPIGMGAGGFVLSTSSLWTFVAGVCGLLIGVAVIVAASTIRVPDRAGSDRVCDSRPVD
ncbi:MAG: MFS transporter [Nocardia sp.]|nr:MFS transporter [Nocardia sp.]